MEFNADMFRLHANLPSFKKKVVKSKSIIDEFMRKCKNPYVSFSTGKDSSAMLGLVREEYNVVAVHVDAGVEMPGCDVVREKFGNVIHHVATPSFMELAKKHGLSSEETRKSASFQVVSERYGFDGIFMGLRRDESAARSFNAKRGYIYEKSDGMLVCVPLLDWTMYDVFAYLVTNNLPIHEHYTTHAPFPLEHRRVGSYVSSRNRGAEYGRFKKIKYFYPTLYYELVNELPELKKY